MVYSCSHCGLQYSRMWSLNRHLRKCFKYYQPTGSVSSEQNDSSSDDKAPPVLHAESLKKRRRVESSSEECESESKQSADEDSEVENCSEIGRDVGNCESETETSESEDEDEEINMEEAEKHEISINWPISRTYRTKYPWSYWGEMPRIKKHIRWLERLKDAEQTTIVYNIQNASNSQLAAICEIAYNCVMGYVPLEHWNLKELRKQRRAVRLLANPDVDMEDKREEILRRGANFIEILLHIINPLILFNIPRVLKVDIPEEEDEEEEENDHES